MNKKPPKSRYFLAPIYFVVGLFIGISINQSPVIEARAKHAKSVSSLSEIGADTASLLPESLKPIHRSCYSLGYDARNKNPSWVYERLTARGLKGDANRDHCQFKEDDTLPRIFRATLQDYQGSGFDRGHLAPAGDHKSSMQGLEDTFFLSNMCPQDPKLNRGYWNKLEKHVRDLTNSYSVVHVYTGPLYLPEQKSDGSKWVSYRVIGENDVAVPTHFFKILLLEKSSGELTYKCYMLPNAPIDAKVGIEQFRTSIEKIEKASGIIFQKQNNWQL